MSTIVSPARVTACSAAVTNDHPSDRRRNSDVWLNNTRRGCRGITDNISLNRPVRPDRGPDVHRYSSYIVRLQTRPRIRLDLKAPTREASACPKGRPPVRRIGREPSEEMPSDSSLTWRHVSPIILAVNGILVSLIAVAGTLLGSLSTYL